MTGFLLLLVALLLSMLWFPFGLLVTVINAIHEGSPRKIAQYLNGAALAIALSIDTLGNVVCRDLLNGWCRKNGGYDFGNYHDTISKVLGKNKELGTLTDAGRALANLLNYIEPNHVENAAKN